jgi:hypothetical protein
VRAIAELSGSNQPGRQKDRESNVYSQSRSEGDQVRDRLQGCKVARVAAKKITKNVDVAVVNRGLDVTVAGKEFRVDRITSTRTANDAVSMAYDLDDYA